MMSIQCPICKNPMRYVEDRYYFDKGKCPIYKCEHCVPRLEKENNKENIKMNNREFKIGDIVKYKNGTSQYIITEIVKTGKVLIKGMTNNSEYVAYEEKLELIHTCTIKKVKQSDQLPFKIDKVISSKPAVIVFFNDGDKIISKCNPNDKFNVEQGVNVAIIKKAMKLNNQKYQQLMKRALKKVETK